MSGRKKKNIVQEKTMADSSHACPHGGSERQANGFMLPDSLDTQREQQYDRMGTSVVGVPDCKSEMTMTNPVCSMKTLGHALALSATYDRQGGKCKVHAK